jgi:hypothetical protein
MTFYRIAVGARVRMTEEGRQTFQSLKHGSERGVVTGTQYIRKGRISVLRDGLKSPASYALKFWELDPDSEP